MATPKKSLTFGAADGYIDPTLNNATDLYNSTLQGKATGTMPGQTRNALKQTRTLANQPIPGLAQAQGFTNDLLSNGGWTPDLRTVQNQYQGVVNNGGWTDDLRKTQGYLDNFANGSYTEDPRLTSMLDTNARRAANAGATMFGNGRYGSAGIGMGIGDSVSRANNETIYASNESARNRQLQASGMLGDLGNTAANRSMAANAGLGQLGEGARQAGMQGTTLIPSLNDLRYDGAERLAGIGDYMNNWNNNTDDWNATSNYINALQGLGGMRTAQQTKGSEGSSAQKAIGMASAGVGLGSKILEAFGGTGLGIL